MLGQRGGLRKLEPSLAQEAFAWQVLCLRLAAIVCHARGEVDTAGLELRRQGNEAALSVPAAWSQSALRTLYLLREEVQACARAGR